MAGHAESDIVRASKASDVDREIEMGKIVITESYEAMCGSGRIDVVIDATGNPSIGTLIALEAMKQGKHIVMLNVEADITIGRFLKEEARKAGVTFTGAAGDEPAATVELIGFAQALGFEIVAAGKGKNNALQFDATPDHFEEEARARNMNARMLVEFVDGSKTAIEMTAVANATGLVPDVPGMHGPKATREELAQVLCTKEDGGILNKSGVVDYSIGKGVAPGVFCVVKPRHPRVLERMIDLKVGPGPCFSLLRPYHLTSLEVSLSAIRAARLSPGRSRAARPSRGRMRGARQARSRSRPDPRQDRRIRLSRLCDGVAGGPQGGSDPAGSRGAFEGSEASQGGRKADLRKLLARRLPGRHADPPPARSGGRPVRAH